MQNDFPAPIPEVPVADVARAAKYYETCLGFVWDWGTKEIGQVSRGNCRLFLTDSAFRGGHSNWTPVVIWLNLNNRAEVDALFEAWTAASASVVSRPEAKPWNLYEFSANDLDGNTFRVFYDFAWELPDRGGRTDGTARTERTRRRST